MGCLVNLGMIVLFPLWFLVVFWWAIGSPYSAQQLFTLDAFALCQIACCLPAFFVWAKPKKAYYLGAGALLFVVALTNSKWGWVPAILRLIWLREATVQTLLRVPSAILVTASLLLLALTWLVLQIGPKIMPKRGAAVRPLKVYEDEQQIVVGAFEPDLLPADMRQFTAAEKGAKISLPACLLTRGISILGDPGSGKSRLMRLLHDGVRRLHPDIPVLIHDPKGEWLRTCYDPANDLIFAPYDKRTVGWDIFADIKEHPQLLSSIAATAVNQHHGAGIGENLYWVDAATSIVKEQLETSGDLMSFRDGLLQWRKDRKDDKTALSAYSSARPAVRDIATIALAGGAGQKRSMDDFLAHRGRIFLLNSPMQAEEQNGAFAIFLSAFMLSCLSQPDATQPRACAIIDEALTFHLPSAVEHALSAQARSKGLITIAGAQWLPKDERRLLTRAEFIFGMKVGDLATGKTLAALCGQTIYDEQVKSETKAAGSVFGGGTTHTGPQERHRELMPPDYFRCLPHRSFVLLHQAGVAPGYTANVAGEQRDDIPAFEYQQQPQISDYMKVL